MPYSSEVSQYEKLRIWKQFDSYRDNNVDLWPIYDCKMTIHTILREKKSMAILGIAYHALLVRGVIVWKGMHLKAIWWLQS